MEKTIMFGQQLQNPIALAAKWTFFGFIIIVSMAILLGTNIKDATWFNPKIAAAQADRINIDTQHQQALNQLDERRLAAQTDAEINEIQRQQALLDAQYRRDIQQLSQDLAHQDLAFRTWMTVFTIISGAFALTLFFVTIIWFGSRALVYVRTNLPKEEQMAKTVLQIEKRIPNLAERESYEPLDPKQVHFTNRLNERLQEIATERESRDNAELLAARMRSLLDPAKMSSEEYRKHPLAGD